ncbi:MAG: SH3 domain-containing protein [Candidatus Omnitrophica bacterium]|nr:SH3 domain-containing protein [Candidatus Omnitrophota bacterium]
MKHYFRFLVLIMFFGAWLLLVSLGPAAAGQFQPVEARVTTGNVNIRAGQGLNFEQLGKLTKSDSVVVLGQEHDWYKIQLPRQARCYAHKDFVDSGIVTAEKLRVRAGRGTNFNILGVLKKGERVEVLEERDPWLRIVPPKSCVGWVRKEYLKLTQRKPKARVSPPPLVQALSAKKVELSGVIDDLGKIANRPGAHKLIVDAKSYYYLKSENIDLNNYLYQKVKVSGMLVGSENCPFPVIEVEQVGLK